MANKQIRLTQEFADHLAAPKIRADAALMTVEVDWFPRLTTQQIWENQLAFDAGKPRPHPNPNLIDITCPYPRHARDAKVWTR